MICLPSHMNPCNTQRFAANGIEAISVSLALSCVNRSIQIALVYRSPSVSQTSLITVLTILLRHVTLCTIPCVIAGDFNEDLLHNPNSSILRLMSSYGFTQLVMSPTTSQGTLIDHVYYRNQCTNSSIVVQVQDTYYSDHDAVYCNIPFNEL